MTLPGESCLACRTSRNATERWRGPLPVSSGSTQAGTASNPADLNPAPRAALSQALLDASGGSGPILERARRALDEGQNQLALELSDVVLSAQPLHVPRFCYPAEGTAATGRCFGEQSCSKYLLKRREGSHKSGSPTLWHSLRQTTRRLEYSGAWIRSAKHFADGAGTDFFARSRFDGRSRIAMPSPHDNCRSEQQRL